MSERTVRYVEVIMNWRLLASATNPAWIETVQRGRVAPPRITTGVHVMLDPAICADWRGIRDWAREVRVPISIIVGRYQFTNAGVHMVKDFVGAKFHFERAPDALYFHMMFGGQMLEA